MTIATKRILILSAALWLFSVIGTRMSAEVKLPPIISDHMVLQQDCPVRIWGKASPGEKVTVSILGQKVSVITDASGKWQVKLRPLRASSPQKLVVSGTNTITINDVLIGEVWVGTGQSNMEWSVKQSNNADVEIANSANNFIRLFKVNHKIADKPVEEVTGEWRICSPEVVSNFSAAEYFFGRELFKVRKEPLGLIESCWSATPGQSWLSKPALEAARELKYITDDWNSTLSKYPEAQKKYLEALNKWNDDSVHFKKPVAPVGPGDKNAPSSLFNGMIAPLTPYAIRGIIWYQGEANAYEKTAYPYRFLLSALINDWRSQWGQGNFPFLVAQLSAFTKHPFWPILRESQLEALQLPKTAVVGTIDIGDSTNAHSKKKQELGFRFSLAARAVAYGEKIVYSGPLYKNAVVEGNAIRITFDYADGLKTVDGLPAKAFTIAGADGKFFPAVARIEGKSVKVSCPHVPEPKMVRYAWADYPYVNLVNAAGLPALSFRSEQ